MRASASFFSDSARWLIASRQTRDQAIRSRAEQTYSSGSSSGRAAHSVTMFGESSRGRASDMAKSSLDGIYDGNRRKSRCEQDEKRDGVAGTNEPHSYLCSRGGSRSGARADRKAWHSICLRIVLLDDGQTEGVNVMSGTLECTLPASRATGNFREVPDKLQFV
jgi:hypothetical protein